MFLSTAVVFPILTTVVIGAIRSLLVTYVRTCILPVPISLSRPPHFSYMEITLRLDGYTGGCGLSAYIVLNEPSRKVLYEVSVMASSFCLGLGARFIWRLCMMVMAAKWKR